MNRNLILTIFNALVLFSCSNRTPQYPTSYKEESFMEYSKKLNRDRLVIENQYFEEYINNHPKKEFIATHAGFKMTKTQLTQKNAQDKDTVSYIYTVKDLQDSIIYSDKEIGKKTEILGKSPMLLGIEHALKRMSQGESATLLLPSSLAYGVNGDGNKIRSNQPLVIEITLLKNRNQ